MTPPDWPLEWASHGPTWWPLAGSFSRAVSQWAGLGQGCETWEYSTNGMLWSGLMSAWGCLQCLPWTQPTDWAVKSMFGGHSQTSWHLLPLLSTVSCCWNCHSCYIAAYLLYMQTQIWHSYSTTTATATAPLQPQLQHHYSHSYSTTTATATAPLQPQLQHHYSHSYSTTTATATATAPLQPQQLLLVLFYCEEPQLPMHHYQQPQLLL